MQLSEAFEGTKELEVQFKSAKLKVVYRPMSYTPAQLDEIQREDDKTSQALRMSEMAEDMIESWDLTRGDGSKVNPDKETIYNEVPVNLLAAVIKAVQKDQSAGEESAS